MTYYFYTRLLAVLWIIVTSCEGAIEVSCPLVDGATNTFTLSRTTTVTVKRFSQEVTLCTLGIEQNDGTIKPMARSYNGFSWERAGSFSGLLQELNCDVAEACQMTLSNGTKYVLYTRVASTVQEPGLSKGEVARFLEKASFGATPADLSTFGTKTFGSYIQEQFSATATMHREYFRRRANPRWAFHHFEFAANSDPCAAGSTWRRSLFTVKDRHNTGVTTRLVNGRWEITINGVIRGLVKQMRFHGGAIVKDGASYTICSFDPTHRRGLFALKDTAGVCRELIADDLIIDFPLNYVPAGTLSSTLPGLNTADVWQLLKHTKSDYELKSGLEPNLCENATQSSIPLRPFFVKTKDGIWLQHDPRIEMRDNSLEAPMQNGGADNYVAKKTSYCSNVPRSFLNEATCFVSKEPACAHSWSNNLVATGVLICGSPGEVANSLSYGDSGMDVSCVIDPRNVAQKLNLPTVTTSAEGFSRQRETVWGDIVLTAPDQLRQRMAFALLHVFSMPKIAIELDTALCQTECFVNYYDIFVRNALGNVLREISYSPLMAESLTFLNSKAVAVNVAKSKVVIYPDENFSREIMQLFTIGLVELNMDGTFVLDANNKPISTYDISNIMSFARAWTGFEYNFRRANVESVEQVNRVDPLRVNASHRDRFPKSDLAGGYIGDYHPLCEDLPDKPFLRIGAKYRLLAASPRPQQVISLKKGASGLYEKLSAFPSVLVLDENLDCQGSVVGECKVDIVRVVLVDTYYYEYVRQPCVEYPLYADARRIVAEYKTNGEPNGPMCANPLLPVASAACCDPDKFLASPSCSYIGERMKRNTAQSLCASVNKTLCDFKSINARPACPQQTYIWTSQPCKIQIKVREDGEIAMIHEFTDGPALLTNATQNFFVAHWSDKKYPTKGNNCGEGACQQMDDYCICDVKVDNTPVFTSEPNSATEILEKLRVGHAGTKMYDENQFTKVEAKGYKYHAPTTGQSCCGIDTVFEVNDANGQTRFLKNVKSTVSVNGATFQFRNPPQFNSAIEAEYSVTDAEHETEALLDHLFFHKNTAPFLAYRFIQRFGVSNPSPRYTKAVATAFRDGVYQSDSSSFGSSKYGCLKATIAAVLLDREARSLILDNDPSHGSMREPILKVIGFMRAMQFNSSEPLVALDLMDKKIGQMPYEQDSVFSFFRPEYSPYELVKLGLAAPEAQVMSSGRVIGLVNGLFSLVKNGLVSCDDGFGVLGDCSIPQKSSGVLEYQPTEAKNYKSVVRGLSDLLTGGRLGEKKSEIVFKAISRETNPTKALQLAMQLIVTSPEFHSTNRQDSRARKRMPPTKEIPPVKDAGYKVVIHLALIGGCDSFNVLVPKDSCTQLYEEYKATRGKLALNSSDVLPLSGNVGMTQQPCNAFTVHKGLPKIQELYNTKELLFMANVGVLTKPCNKTNCLARTVTQLFAHNTMQDEVNSLDPFNVAVGTGPMGRMADVLQSMGYNTNRTAVESTAASLGGRSIIAPPVVRLDQTGAKAFNRNASAPNMTDVIDQLNGEGGDKSGIYGEVWSSLLE